MLCICKREIRSFFHSMIGWVFGAFLLLMAGIYFTAYNLNYGYPLFSYTLSSITFLFLIVSPILAMRTLAEERKQKTDQLLLTAPVTVWQIVLGKYLALIVIGIDVLSITSSNAGGHIAHLGGALAGLWFAASLSKGTDLTSWINRILDGFISLFQKKTWKRKPKMKVHYGNSATGRERDYDYNAQKKAQSDEVDRILEKLKKSGYDSLTTEEKKSLFDASKR